ncbi:utx histone demethylase isoform X2 [Brevipalpus obovatus]
MYHIEESLGENAERQNFALSYLESACKGDYSTRQSFYFLGRCYANLGQARLAFESYRASVDKSEANADTWCSIGVLYQQQNQFMDALQAYICSVQLDKSHTAAWTNLGILYESFNQPHDALKCYMNAVRGKGSINSGLADRIKFFQSNLASAPPSNGQSPQRLPCLEDAWNIPISQEMASRQNSIQRANQEFVGDGIYQSKRQRIDSVGNRSFAEGGNIHSEVNNVPTITPQQIQLMTHLQKNHANLKPNDKTLLAQLQNQYRLFNQEQQTKQMMCRQTDSLSLPNPPEGRPNEQYNTSQQQFVSASNAKLNSGAIYDSANKLLPGTKNCTNPSLQDGSMESSEAVNSITRMDTTSSNSLILNGSDSSSSPSNSISESELRSLLSPKQSNYSISDTLIEEYGLAGGIRRGGREHLNSSQTNTAISNSALSDKSSDNKYNHHPHRLSDSSIHRPFNKWEQILSSSLSPHSSYDSTCYPQPIRLSIEMSAAQAISACKGIGKTGRIDTNLLSDDCRPPSPIEAPYPPLPKDKLLPQTPSVFIDNKKDANSASLQEFCLAHPIAVVRGLTSVLKLDLGLFSTKTLVEANPDHLIEVRTQLLQLSDENWDPDRRSMVWRCESHRSHMSIARYAHYQASSFQESLKEEQDKVPGAPRDSDSDSNSSATSKIRRGRRARPFKTVKFGTNVDLSDDKKWLAQLLELRKLPTFARVSSAQNMLSHVGHVILGMNTVQLYMKVPGCRTPGHQENNNFCSVNINIGPGDCEWFGVPEEYWGAINRLCQKNNLSFLHGSWWPILEDLFAENIPVYRFLQRPGDVVWVNAGTIHWVQAIGWCNNIAWNVGPLTAKQYQLAVERYEWNKLENFKSIVPVIHLTWNLARNLKCACQEFYKKIRICLLRSLKNCQMIVDFVKNLDKEIQWHGKGKEEAAHYCVNCEVEVFNLLFVRELEKKHVVHCIDCARKLTPDLDDFVILEEYRMEELMEVYDSFQLFTGNGVYS